jgi:hypothetical protein
MIRNLLEPFLFVRYQHPELRFHQLVALLAAVAWAVADGAQLATTGETINFFHPDGVLASINGMQSVMVGIYFGLAGVFVASVNAWLDDDMPGGIYLDDPAAPVTRREFFLAMLVYCAAVSTVLVFASAVVVPAVLPFAGAALDAADLKTGQPVRGITSVAVSSVAMWAVAHVYVVTIQSLWMLRRTGLHSAAVPPAITRVESRRKSNGEK